MHVQLIKFVDTVIGSLLCIILGVASEISRLLKKRHVEVNNILVIRLWAVGETILTLPMIKKLKDTFPDSKITVLTTPRVKTIFESVDFIDDMIMWSPGQMFKNWNKFDLAIDTEPYLTISAISAYFMAKERLGFANRLRTLLYTLKVPFNDKQHEVYTFLDLVKMIGIDYKPKALERLHGGDEAKKFIIDYMKERGFRRPILGLCAGSADSATVGRRWMPERYAQVADQFIAKYKGSVIFTGTPGERKYIEKIIGMMSNKGAHNAAGETNLKQLIELINQCDVFVSNDTGPMHVAAAQGVNTVGLFGPNMPVRFRPFGENNIALYMKMYCSPCINVHKGEIKNCDKPLCMELISVASVMEAIDNILPTKDYKNEGDEDNATTQTPN